MLIAEIFINDTFAVGQIKWLVVIATKGTIAQHTKTHSPVKIGERMSGTRIAILL